MESAVSEIAVRRAREGALAFPAAVTFRAETINASAGNVRSSSPSDANSVL